MIENEAVAIAAGYWHSMVLKKDGSVWATGYNKHGQLGNGTTNNKNEFTQVIDKEATAIAASGQYSMVLKTNGSVWSTGSNMHGQLGKDKKTTTTISQLGKDKKTTTAINEFTEVMAMGAVAIAAGYTHSMVLKNDDSVWTTGSNNKGQLGNGSTKARSTYARITGVFDLFHSHCLCPCSRLTPLLLYCRNR